MSAIYKVMNDMQKLRPSRLRRASTPVAAFGLVVVMLAGVHIVRSTRIPEPSPATHPKLTMPVAKEGSGCYGEAPAVVISVDADGDWVVQGKGKVSEEEFQQLLVEQRETHGPGFVGVRIGADQKAWHLKRIHEIASDCGMSKLLIGKWDEAPERP